ncbi:MAG: hypothetical protein JWO86_4491 [Myxococcaceae bacterium]|nr:hypothetical protein [Myxococcaceae bacterium]
MSRGPWLCPRRGAARGIVVALVSSACAMAAPATAGADEPALDPNTPFPPPSPRVLEPPDRGYTYANPQPYPSLAWFVLQLIPSPEVAVGRVHEANATGTTDPKTDAAFGLRWQVTPLLWSWGTNRHASRWRTLVVDPLARHAGSIELSGTAEYLWGNVDRAILRPGVRAYFPIAQRGEYLSVSLGTSTYAYDDKMRVAYDVGAYVLWGLFGVQATIAPENGPLTAIGTFRIRYF